MTSELRRSFKQKAKETFGFRLSRRSDGDIRPGSLDELEAHPQSAPPILPSPTPGPDTVSIATKETVPVATRPTSMLRDADGSMDGREKRRSRHLVQPKGTISYEVAGRDTLASIAAQFDTTTSELKKVNKLMTTMVFPGQVVFVPDKEYVPSEASSTPTPTSPLSPASPQLPAPDKLEDASVTSAVQNGTASPPTTSDAKAAFDIKLTRLPKAPGLAKRQVSSDEPVSPAHLPPSEDEARKLADECFERFIKVNVKHITDGQGVVSGVLLVTPNAIMFDPNVSDPLVMDRGPEEYGMIAPIDTIISAAIYHDIAAMNQKNRVRTDSGGPGMEVYHDKTCALYKCRNTPSPEPSPQEMSPFGRMPRSGSVCSCGAMDRNRSLIGPRERNTSESSQTPQVVRVNSSVKVGFLGDSFSVPKDIPESGNDEESGIEESGDHKTIVKPSGEGAESVDRPDETSQQSSIYISAAVKEEAATQPAEIQLDSQNPTMDKDTDLAESGQVQVKEISETEPNSQDAHTNTSTIQAASSGALSPHMQIGNIQYFSPDMRRSPSPQRDDLSIPRDSGGSPKPSSSPKEQGLLSRTLGSLSSLGSSFPGSPNLTSLATGLFSWNHESGLEQPVSAASLLRDRSVDDGEVFPEQEHGEAERKSFRESLGESTDSSERDRPRIRKIFDVEVEVENLVKLQDKPQLFQDLSELIPKPATHYEDPPLYLCLRVGLPSNKRVSKTCPIESYMKHKHKPEYWFCVPRDKVDPLYAFFLQWSPNIYGSEDEMAEREQRFVVVTHSDDDADLELVDNHFERMSLKSRQMTKDWEIVNLEEARRRLSCAEVENLPLPELSDRSFILDEMYMRRLCLHLPARAEGYPWTLVYSSEKHGFSLKTLYRTMFKMDCPILIIIKDTESHVFGAMLPCAIVLSDHFYGTGESYLFTFHPEFKRFGWSGANNFFIKGNPESLSIGAGQGSFGLWLDGDLYHGTTQSCETYNNDLLTGSEDFVVKGLEAWGFL